MKRMLWALVFVVAGSGCTVTKDGIGVKQSAPTATKVAEVRQQLQHNAETPGSVDTANPSGTSQPVEPGVLIVGTTGPLRVIEEKDRPAFYAAYLKMAEQWHPGQPASLDSAAFSSKATHWASIQIAGIPGLMSWRLPVMVPSTMAHDAQFASATGSFMFGTTGDLVVAKSDHDGLVWLDRVLCKDDNTYRACAKRYQAGIFDANTGQELDKQHKPKAGGAVLEPGTLLKVARP